VARIGQRGCLIQVLNDERGLDPLLVPAPRRPMWDAVHPPVLFRRRAPRGLARGLARAVPRQEQRRTARPGGRWRASHRPLTDDQVIAMLPESGRGLAIMRACVDDVTLSTDPSVGTVVSLEKRMAWRDDALLARPAEFPLSDDDGLDGTELREGQLRNVG
jgi:hypothetical protein